MPPWPICSSSRYPAIWPEGAELTSVGGRADFAGGLDDLAGGRGVFARGRGDFAAGAGVPSPGAWGISLSLSAPACGRDGRGRGDFAGGRGVFVRARGDFPAGAVVPSSGGGVISSLTSPPPAPLSPVIRTLHRGARLWLWPGRGYRRSRHAEVKRRPCNRRPH